jgi:hypothetical protein
MFVECWVLECRSLLIDHRSEILFGWLMCVSHRSVGK